jgi:hypothetical protein
VRASGGDFSHAILCVTPEVWLDAVGDGIGFTVPDALDNEGHPAWPDVSKAVVLRHPLIELLSEKLFQRLSSQLDERDLAF